jgi:hypothetical protein
MPVAGPIQEEKGGEAGEESGLVERLIASRRHERHGDSKWLGWEVSRQHAMCMDALCIDLEALCIDLEAFSIDLVMHCG